MRHNTSKLNRLQNGDCGRSQLRGSSTLGLVMLLALASQWCSPKVEAAAHNNPPPTHQTTRVTALDETPMQAARSTEEARRFDDKLQWIERAIWGGRLTLAERAIQELRHTAETSHPMLDYFEGMIAKKRGRHREAVGIFRAILAARPDYARVRMNLAHTLYLLEKDESARHHFEILRGGVDNPKMLARIEQFLERIEKRRHWSASAFIALAPSTNVNRGTQTTHIELKGYEFLVNDDSRAKSGVGVTAGGALELKTSIYEDVDLLTSVKAFGKRYQEDDFNFQQAGFDIGPRWRFDQGSVALKATYEKRWAADEAHNEAVGGLILASYRPTPGVTTAFRFGCAATRHDFNWFDDHLDAQDGETCRMSLSIDRYVGLGALVRFMIGGQEAWSQSDHLEYGERYLGVGAYKELPAGLSLYGEVRGTSRIYDSISTLTEARRADKMLDVAAHLTKRDFDIFGFAPRVSYKFSKRLSNNNIYDYTAHGADFTLTREF